MEEYLQEVLYGEITAKEDRKLYMPQRIKGILIVSIIVPAYNEEKHIEECLASIKNQTYPKIELVVVDDGSTDATRKIAKKYSDVFIIQKHQGPGTARNKAAKIAKGEILVFIDADMYLDKNYIKNIIKPIVEGKAIATFTKEEYVANPENIWSKCYAINNELFNNLMTKDSFLEESNVFRCIDKKKFLLNGGFNVKLGYADDHFFSNKDKTRAVVAKGAICYHYNPDTIKDVFFSARWVGRSMQKSDSIKYLFINSIKIAVIRISAGAPLVFLPYKIIFDLGIFLGILSKDFSLNSSK